MKTVILAGGLGTRLAEETGVRPKPMVEIGGQPILWHVMSIYAQYGFREFVIACGYKGSMIKQYFNDLAHHHSDWSLDLVSGERQVMSRRVPDWRVHCVDTGAETLTGGRLLCLKQLLVDGTFMVTYGDGVSDVPVDELVAFHRAHGKLATVTAVHPPARFGALELRGDAVSAFAEKPQTDVGWINGGFFVFEPGIFDYLEGAQTSLEKDALERVAADGQLMAFRHDGFFQPMDTLRERQQLEELWRAGTAPWAPKARTPKVKDAVNAALRSWYAGRRTFVTGHTGFKGAWLTAWLRDAGADVAALALAPEAGRPSLYEAARVGDGILSTYGDIRDAQTVEDAIADATPEIVFHLAAQSLVRRSYTDPLGTFATNVMGTAHVLDAVRRVPSVRAVVIVTSDKCYENVGIARGYREDDAMGGHDPYSASKGCAELVTSAMRRSFAHDTDVAIASVRAGNVIGGGDWAEDRLVPDLMRDAAAGRETPIRRPDAVRPWQHVLEPLRGYLMVGQALVDRGTAFAEAWNFGPRDGDTVTVREVVTRISERWPSVRAAFATTETGPHEAHLLSLDSTKAHTTLGWAPALTLDDTIDLTVDWYRGYTDDPSQARTLLRDQLHAYERRVDGATLP